MFKKFFSLFAALTLSVGLWAETVAYRYPTYIDDDVTKGIDMWLTSSKDATPVTSTSSTWGAAGEETWFVVSENVTISQRVTCEGDVHLILANDVTLNATQGITVSSESNSLTIYAQTEDIAQMGQLIANGGINAAGIGGGFMGYGSNITINGGIITTAGGNNGAGIGGGEMGYGSNITINGGIITTAGGKYGAGIGGGFGSAGSDITINGGEVTATGGKYGAGIGGGMSSPGSNITILAGTVTATGGEMAAGIGGGYDGSAVNIFVATDLLVKASSSANPTTVIAHTHTATTDIATDLADKQYAKIILGFVLPEKTAGQYATICLPRPMTGVTNGTLYKISHGNIYEVHFVEETNFTADPAGTPYLVQAEADGDIVFTMADAEPVTAPVGVETANGFVASLQDEMQTVPEGYNYLLVSGGELHSAGPGCQLSKNHAYIDVNYVPASAPEPQGAPRRVVLYNAEAQSPTGLGQWNKDKGQRTQKLLRNGQLLIIRDNNVYNAQGQIVK